MYRLDEYALNTFDIYQNFEHLRKISKNKANNQFNINNRGFPLIYWEH